MFCFFYFFLFSAYTAQAKTLVFYQWLELGPDNRWIVRVITPSSLCPVIQTVQKNLVQKIRMEIRTGKSKNFPVMVCQTVLSPDTASVLINRHPVKLPVSDPKRIVIIGDTGCRMKKGIEPQICNDPKQWSFPTTAKSAALFKPDLIIHAGDYYYRESLGKPQGDKWAAWEADFFHPAKPLLNTAPLVFTRGNHEICERGGEGWTKLLDPFSFKHCVNHSPLYRVNINKKINLFVIDSANVSDILAPANEVSLFENYLRQILQSAGLHSWIVTHKPFWFVFSDDKLSQAYQANLMNTLESAWLNVHPDNVDAVFSGHIHQFESLNFEKDRPAQIIMGASGTRLANTLKQTDLKDIVIGGIAVHQGLSLIHSGYMTLEKSDKSDYAWKAQFRDPQGKILAKCDFELKKFVCRQSRE